ncbi:MAG: prepilin-type N-terminal cleavage/methylation domain-containing protein [Deltaproteobacteria bacterium]|nr:prepilin-type N-terminal cleavage/methylation domain-containing protein [Deltaproteobacteria bacterium]
MGRRRRGKLRADAHRAWDRAGFTLLEILAVLLIGGLLMSIMLPNFGAVQTHKLRNSAEQIVERIDFGRQRAVMTGVPHRLAIDLDAGTYRLEWQGDRPAEQKKPAKPDLEFEFEPDAETQLSLAPPPSTERSFETLQGPLGKLETLGRGIEFAWIETPGGETDFGEAHITFEGDGTSSYTLLVLDEPGGRELALEILPLAEMVRILDEEF